MVELTRRTPLALATMVLALAQGCDGCEAEPAAVPFKRVQAVAPNTPEPEPAGTDAGARGEAFSPKEGQSHPPSTSELEIAGARVHVGDGSVLSSLPLDLDTDGLLDVLLLVSRPDAPLALAFAMVGPQGPGPLQASSSPLALAGDCTVHAARLTHFARSYVLASAQAECPDGSSPAGTPPTTRTQAHQWIVSAEPAPRALEHLWHPLDRSEIALSVRADDVDADGHQDVRVALGLGGGPAGEQTRFQLSWLNRPSGLGRDPSEPERSLLEHANQARAALKKEPARAAALAQETLRLHGLLCREAGTAVIGVGAALGIPCGPSAAAGRAAAVLCTALANTGQVYETLRALEALSSPAYQLAPADAQRARDAAARLPRVAGVRWLPGPRLTGPAQDGVRRPRIGFLDDDHLLVRGPAALSYALSDASSVPTGQDAESRVLSPDGLLAVGAVFRSCDGYHLQVLDAAQLVQGLAVGKSRAEPLIAPAAPPAAARCPGALSRALRQDTGGIQVLDWTDRGVLLARDEERWLVPTGTDGLPHGEPVLLASNEAVAPRVPGALSADGSRYVRLSPLGVVRITLGATLRTELLPEVPGEGELGDAVISASGRSVAVMRGQQAYVTRLGALADAPARPVSAVEGNGTPGPIGNPGAAPQAPAAAEPGTVSATSPSNGVTGTDIAPRAAPSSPPRVDLPAPPDPPSPQ